MNWATIIGLFVFCAAFIGVFYFIGGDDVIKDYNYCKSQGMRSSLVTGVCVETDCKENVAGTKYCTEYYTTIPFK